MLLPPSATLPRLPTAVWRSLHRTLPRPHTRSAAGASSSPAPIPSTLPHYADYPLDRAAALRSDTDRLQQLLLNPTSRLLLYQSGRPLLQPNTDPTAPDPQGNPAAWQPVAIRPASRALPHVRCERETVFLGTDAEGAVFAAEVPDDADVEVLICAMGLSSGTLVGNLRKHGPRMTPPNAALSATAGGLLQWHRRTSHDPASGAPLTPTQGGHARAPPPDKGGRSVYPRLDPAVIALVTCGDWALLGRKAAWEAGRYSCLAGFCEVGETLEQAVVREVAEEAGVVVDHRNVAYHSSQPWPFPSSLMVGFIATAEAGAPPRHGFGWLGREGADAAQAVGLTEAEVHAAHSSAWLPDVSADEDEMQDARWFHRDALCDVLRGQPAAFRIPQQYALAHRIVQSWLAATQRPLDALPTVRIDEGVFKYILARVRHVETGASTLVVRGDLRAGYHDHLLGHLRSEAALHGLEVDVCGGGRMEHHAEQQVVQVYGYSSAFGAAPHEVTAALLSRALPLYPSASIVTSYEGY